MSSFSSSLIAVAAAEVFSDFISAYFFLAAVTL
jgi:hypothetical protein